MFRSKLKTSTWILFCLSVSLTICINSVHATTDSSPPPKSEEKTDIDQGGPIQTEKIDQSAEAISQGIEQFGRKASSYFGSWINAEAFAGITWLKLSVCLGMLAGVLIVERLLRMLIQAKISKIPSIDGEISWARLILRAMAKPLSLFIWVYGVYWAASPLFIHFRLADGSNLVHLVAERAADIGGSFALVWFFYLLVSVIDNRLMRWAKGTPSNIDDILVPIVGKTLRFFIIVVGSMVIIQNLTGIKIGPLLASLGIGGLAIALAAKDSIANFFGTLTILFDKPFLVGERILIDNYDGVVENVGFRSTRIRTLTGHVVTIPNEKVSTSGLENISKRPHIRWLTNIGVTYDTPPEKVEKAVAMIRDILENHEGLNPEFPPRVFFNGFNDWSLNITVVVWYHPPDYWAYQDWLQRTCLKIMRGFQAEGIDFAFPSRTVYLAGDDKRRVTLEMLKGE